jgi:hypothetical protein
VGVVGLMETELGQNRSDVFLNRSFGHPELTGHARVGAALGHERQYLAFTRAERCQRVAAAARCHELLNDCRVDDVATFADALKLLDELVNVGDPALEQVANSLAAGKQLEGLINLDVRRQDHDAHLGETGSNLERGGETFRCVGRGHADVHDYQIRHVLADQAKQVCAVLGQPNDVEAVSAKHAGDAFTQERVVVRHHDPGTASCPRLVCATRAHVLPLGQQYGGPAWHGMTPGVAPVPAVASESEGTAAESPAPTGRYQLASSRWSENPDGRIRVSGDVQRRPIRDADQVQVTTPRGWIPTAGCPPIKRRAARVRKVSAMGCHVDPALFMALFVSDISYDPYLTDVAVRDAIGDTLERLGVDGCYAEAAEVFGDRPEVAVGRMRWVREVVARAVAHQSEEQQDSPATPRLASVRR